MKHNIMTLIGKIVAKVLALFALSGLTIIVYVLKIFAFAYQFIAVPLSILGIVMVGYDCFTGGVTVYNIACIVGFLGAVALRYMLPLILAGLDKLMFNLKDYVFAPLHIKSPVRYTL